jgi:hypothetical protein
MLILGLLLLVAAGLLTTGLLAGNTGNVHAEVFGYTVTGISLGELFAIGVCTGVVLTAGLVLLFSGLRRSGRKRKARREELGAKRAHESELQEENARLARQLDQQRRAGAGPAQPAAPPFGPAGEQHTTVLGAPASPAPPASGASPWAPQPPEPSPGAPEPRP